MKNTLEEIKKYIPGEIIDRLPRKKFNAGDIILDVQSNYFLLLTEGTAHGIRYQEGKRIIFPYLFKKGSMAGFNMLVSKSKKSWEFISTTPGEAIIFPADVVEKYIFQVPASFKFFVEQNILILETGLKGFYILAHGGAKAYLAFLLNEGAVGGVFSFRRYENFTDVLGVSKSMLFRLTKELIEKKLIRKERKRVIILNSQGLKDLYREYFYF